MFNFLKKRMCKHEYHIIGTAKNSSQNDVVHLYCPRCKRRFVFRVDEWERMKNVIAIDEEYELAKNQGTN